MTGEALERLWAVRLEGLRRTIKRAAAFKACDQCRSICPKEMGVCPWCHCYRFNENTETVLATLREMAEVPFPAGSPVVPRLTAPGRTSASMLGGHVICGPPSPERPQVREHGFFN